jgi:hypothetical protein
MPPKRDSVTGVTAKNGFIVWWTHFFFVSSQHEKVHVIVDGCLLGWYGHGAESD